VGRLDGLRVDVGRIDGRQLGFLLGVTVGKDGIFEGITDGELVEVNDGIILGLFIGSFVGFFEGTNVGTIDDKYEGILLGNFDGD